MATGLKSTLIQPLPPKSTTASIINLPLLGHWPYSTVPSALAFDHELDKDRLVEAIRLLSSIWPTIAGRYERRPIKRADGTDGYEYFMRLTSSPIPFSTQDFRGSKPFLTTDVIQSSIDPFAPELGSKRLDFSRTAEDDKDAFHFAVRLTTLIDGDSRTSILGVNTSHIITDGAALNKILHHLSHCYVHLALPPETEFPTFNAKIHFDRSSDVKFPPDEAMSERWTADWVTGEKISAGKVVSMIEDDCFKVVKLFVSRKEIGEYGLRGDLLQSNSGNAVVRLSEQDVLSAWWFSLLRRVGITVTSVSNVFDARQVLPTSHPSIDASMTKLGVSLAQFCQFPLPTANPTNHEGDNYAAQLETDAIAVRTTINAIRTNPQTVLEWLSYNTWKMQLTADAGVPPSLEPLADSGTVCVNSNGRCDWTPTFGSETARYYTFWAGRRFLRVFQRNPKVGEKMKSTGERDLELAFKVEKEKYEALMSVVEGDRARWEERAERGCLMS